jgi:hypothetical protein
MSATIHKFGYTEDAGTTEYPVSWAIAADQTYPAAETLIEALSSDNTGADTSTGTGARTVVVQGVDGNYNEVSATIALNGTTAVPTTQKFLRVYRAYVATAGTGGAAVGTITIRISAAGATLAIIPLLHAQSLMAIYTVPQTVTGLGAISQLSIHRLYASVGAAPASKLAVIRLAVREFGGVWRTKMVFNAPVGFFTYDYLVPLVIPAKADIELRADASTATTAVAAGFDATLY